MVDERRERLIEAAALLLSHAEKRTMNITVLNKALFYLDLAALRDTGKTVTRATYVALPQGPVVAKYEKRLIRPMEEESVAIQLDRRLSDGSKPMVLVDEPSSYRFIDGQTAALAAAVAAWACGETAARLSDLSHDNIGWQIAWEEGLGSSEAAKPIDMRIAMQQLVAKDPWMTVALTDEEERAVESVDDGNEIPWT